MGVRLFFVIIAKKKDSSISFLSAVKTLHCSVVFSVRPSFLSRSHQKPTMSQSEPRETVKKAVPCSELQQKGVSVNPRAVCNACKRLYRDPKILPCLHTFCSDCIGQLEPFSAASLRRGEGEHGRSGEAPEANRTATVTVLCPDCDTEVDIPQSGPAGLSTDHLALDEVFLETLVSDAPLGCDLCGEGAAESRCEVCCVNLCEFCCQAHR